MTHQANMTNVEPSQVDACRVKWDDVPFTPSQPAWQSLELPRSLSMPEHIFEDLGDELLMRSHSSAQQMLADDDYDSSHLLSQDCILSPPTSKIDTQINWADPTVRLWPRDYHSSLEPSPISPPSAPLDATQGMRREVSSELLACQCQGN